MPLIAISLILDLFTSSIIELMRLSWISIPMPVRIRISVRIDPGAKTSKSIKIASMSDFLRTTWWKCNQWFNLIFCWGIYNLLLETVWLRTSLLFVFWKSKSFIRPIRRMNDRLATFGTKETFHFERMALREILYLHIVIYFGLFICQQYRLGLIQNFWISKVVKSRAVVFKFPSLINLVGWNMFHFAWSQVQSILDTLHQM